MKLQIVAACTAALSFLLMAIQWSSGYFALLAPFSILTPLVLIGIFLSLAALTLVTLVLLCIGRQGFRDRAIFAAVALVAASLPFWSSLQLAGFEFRVRQMTEVQWQRLADDVRQAKADADSDASNGRRRDQWDRDISIALAATHPVLAIGDFPPKLSIRKEHVGVYWGSGLIGTLAVEVSVEPQPALSRGYRQRTLIYDRVVMVWD